MPQSYFTKYNTSPTQSYFDKYKNIPPPAPTKSYLDRYKDEESEPGFWSRTWDFTKGLGEFGGNILRATHGDIGAAKRLSEGMTRPFKEAFSDEGKKAHPSVVGRGARLISQLAGLDPDAISEDWEKNRFGALAGDLVAPIGLGVLLHKVGGAVKGAKGAIAEPKVKILPDVEVPKVKTPAERGFTELPAKTEKNWDWSKFDAGDVPKAEGYKPKTTQGAELPPPSADFKPWDFDKYFADDVAEAAKLRGQGIGERLPDIAETEKVRVKYKDENGVLRTKTVTRPKAETSIAEQAMHGRLYKGRRYGGRTIAGNITDTGEHIVGETKDIPDRIGGSFLNSDPFWATIPDRLRPEAPNVGTLRNLSEGTPKVGTGARVRGNKFNFIDEAEWLKQQEAVKAAEQAAKPLPEVKQVVLEGKPKEPLGPEAKPISGKLGRLNNKKFMEANPELKAIFDKLIKFRSAGDLIGKGIRDKFKGVAHISKDDLPSFQQGIAEGRYPEVRQFFDELHQKMNELGIPVEKKSNYLPQLWEEKMPDIVKAYGDKQLGEKAPFQFESIYKDYAHGISRDLTPKMSPIKLMEWYGRRANKLIADQTALKEMKAAGYLVKEPRALSTMERMSQDLGSFKDYYAHPEVKKVLENYLKGAETQTGLFADIAKLTGKATNLALSSGLIPNKPLFTAHGLNMATRAFLEGGTKRSWETIKRGWNPKKYTGVLESENAAMTEAAQKYGFKAHVENPPGTQTGHFFEDTEGRFGGAKEKFNWLTEKQHQYWEGPLFERMIPASKWEAWKARFAEFKSKGLSETEAGHAATKITDHFYSGKNIDLLYNSKHFNTAARILTLAPDWLRSTKDLGIEIPKSLVAAITDRKNPVSRVYQKAGARLLATYAAANMLQKATTGKFMVENDPADMFNLHMGEDVSGEKTRSLKLYGSAADFFKVPIEAAMAAFSDTGKGAGEVIADSATAKLSPLMQLGRDVTTGQDYRGDVNLFGTKDTYNKTVPAGQRLANTLSQGINFGPPQVAAPYDALTGKMTLEEAISRIGELPFTYRNKKKNQPGSLNMKGMSGLQFPR